MAENGGNNKVTLIEIKATLSQIQGKQEEAHHDIREIKEALFEPDRGLFARVKTNTQFRKSASKVLWAFFIAITGGIAVVLREFILK